MRDVMASTRIRLGGIKILEGRSHLTSLCKGGEAALTDICSRLAADRINLSLLTFISDTANGTCASALSTDRADGFSGYFHMRAVQGCEPAVKLHPGITILSVFPHDQKASIIGEILGLLTNGGMQPYGIASSTSAMSVLISSADTPNAIDGLFGPFEFPTYRSPYDWHAAYREKEHVLKEIICSYEEQIIKVYNLVNHCDLDLWKLKLPRRSLGNLGAAFMAMDRHGIKLPFLVAQPDEEESMFFAMCLPSEHRQKIRHTFAFQLPGIEPTRLDQVTMLSLHGPHFGDRYGIARALVSAMQSHNIAPLAISCTIASISVVVRTDEMERATAALGTSFQIPL